MPGVPIKLLKLDGSIRPQTYGLADSGCDFSNFPFAWAEDLGVDLEDCHETEGNTAGGTAKKFLYPPGIDAIIFGKKIHVAAFFSPGLPIALLGREDFFHYFHAHFDQRAQSFHLRAYEPFYLEHAPGDFTAGVPVEAPQ
jgi:hypothetical protein